MYADMIAMLFSIAIVAVPACWVLDRVISWMWDRIL
jgi:hypothetical protein